MDFGDFPAGYSVHFFPVAKDEKYRSFSSFCFFEAAQGEIWDEEEKLMVNLQEK